MKSPQIIPFWSSKVAVLLLICGLASNAFAVQTAPLVNAMEPQFDNPSDTVRIQKAVDFAISNGRAGIYLPGGTYGVARAADGITYSINIRGATNFAVVGDGPGTVVFLANTRTNNNELNVFRVTKSSGIRFRNLTIDGNDPEFRKLQERSSGIFVDEAVSDIVVEGCNIRNCRGDGVQVKGSGKQESLVVSGVQIVNCLLWGNRRSGVAIQRATKRITIANCRFENTKADSDIDMEISQEINFPHFANPTEVTIHGCTILHTNTNKAIAVRTHFGVNSNGLPFNEPTISITGNTVVDGQLFVVDAVNLMVQNNRFSITSAAPKFTDSSVIEVREAARSVTITGNQLRSESSNIEVLVLVGGRTVGNGMNEVLIANNLLHVKKKNGIEVLSASDVMIQGNMIVATAKDCINGIRIGPENTNVNNILIQQNIIRGNGDISSRWQNGLKIESGSVFKTGQLLITGNSIRNTTNGIFFDGNPLSATPICALNIIEDFNTNAISGIEKLPEKTINVGGAFERSFYAGQTPPAGTYRPGGRSLAGTNSPEGNVTGDIGDTYQWLRTNNAAGAFFVKESGNGTKAGWVGK